MNKGTAIVGFILSFLAGIALMYGIDRSAGVQIASEESTGQAALDQSAAPVPVTAQDPQWGKPDALVTIVEISDFECPFCARVGPTIKRLKDEYGPSQLRVVWKNSPLPFHKNAKPAAVAAATVFGLAGADAFWKFHDLLFANQRSLTEENLAKWAQQAGVNPQKYQAAIKEGKYAKKVEDDLAMAQKVGATGTPAFRINGVTLVGAQPYDKFKDIVDAQLKEAKALVASGTPKSRVYVELTKKNAGSTAAAEDTKKPDEKKAEQPPEDTSIWKVLLSKDDPQKGPKDALVTVVIFSDYQCPFCKRVEDTLKQVEQKYGKDVRFVWKDNPLPFHPRALPAATLAMVAFKQKGDEGFWKAHDLLFQSQPKLEDEDLQRIAGEVGVPWAMVKQAIDTQKFKEAFAADQTLAEDLEARGTPHFFVNGFRVKGAQPFEKFQQVIDAQLAKAKALVDKGVARASVYDEIMKEGKEPPPPEKKDVGTAPKDSPSKGPKNAKVTIQEFSDFQCPYCKRAIDSIREVEKNFGTQVRVVWRNMPLAFHNNAMPAAEAAREAYEQKGDDGFWKFHDKLWEAQDQQGGLERAGLEKIAQELGLDMAKFKQALDSHKHKARIEADSQQGNKVQINGTPAFVINGYFINGAQPYSAFKKAIQRALKEAK
jgi:protein-disulfide isomerase